MEHIAIESHFPHIGPHIADASLVHALLNKGLLLLGHHHMEMDRAAAFFVIVPPVPGSGVCRAVP